MIYQMASFASVMSTIGNILLALLLFALLIFIHELGHYTAGKIFKFKINEFSIGFGKALFSKKLKNGEIFSIRVIPLGGYCAFEGEDENSEVEGAFNNQAWWKRWIVLFAGVFFNFISAIIVAIPLLMVWGDATPIIKTFDVNSPNHIEYNMETLQEGDIIVKVNGSKPTLLGGGITYLINEQGDATYTVTVERNNELVDISVTNYIINQDEDGNVTYGIGITGYENLKYGFFEAVGRSVPFCFEMAWDCLKVLGNLIIGKVHLSNLGGPVTTISMIVEGSSISPIFLLVMFPVIAINLAVFNFLPFPALDGGRSVFVILEGIRRKPINQKLEQTIHSVGLYILLGFVILVDVLQIFVF